MPSHFKNEPFQKINIMNSSTKIKIHGVKFPDKPRFGVFVTLACIGESEKKHRTTEVTNTS